MSEVEVGRDVPHRDTFRSVLQRWSKLHDAYREKVDDLAWWYSERANISVLSAAFWQEEGTSFALQDLRVMRGRRGARKGRGDVRVHMADFAVNIEARLVWPRLANRKAVEAVKDALADADSALNDHDPDDRADVGISMAFVVPELNVRFPDKIVSRAHELGELLRNDLVRGRGDGLWAEVFVPPEQGRSWLGKDERYAYPAAFLVGRLRWPRF